MKTTFMAVLLALPLGTQASPKFNKLVCSDADGKVMTITNLGTNNLKVMGSFLGDADLPRTTDGDCSGRKSYCFQDGQWMINLPVTLAAGTRKTGRVWENTDVDDCPENHRLGAPYDCVATK